MEKLVELYAVIGKWVKENEVTPAILEFLVHADKFMREWESNMWKEVNRLEDEFREPSVMFEESKAFMELKADIVGEFLKKLGMEED